MTLKALFAAATQLTVFFSSVVLAEVCPKISTVLPPCGVVPFHFAPKSDTPLHGPPHICKWA